MKTAFFVRALKLGDLLKALLIYPEFPDTFWSFKHALKFIHKKAAFPPLGLLTLGAMLPEEWSTRLIDVNVKAVTEKDLAWADTALISAMSVQRDSAYQIIARCKGEGLRLLPEDRSSQASMRSLMRSIILCSMKPN